VPGDSDAVQGFAFSDEQLNLKLFLQQLELLADTRLRSVEVAPQRP